MNLKRILAFSSFFVVQLTNAACLKETDLKQLSDQELKYMLNRIPPAFSHAVLDQQITHIHTIENQ